MYAGGAEGQKDFLNRYAHNQKWILARKQISVIPEERAYRTRILSGFWVRLELSGGEVECSEGSRLHWAFTSTAA